MNAIEDGRGGWHDGNGEAEPIAGMNADGQEDEDEAEVGRMADETIEAGTIEFLRIENGDVGAKGFAESVNRGPADDERENQDEQAGGFQGVDAAEHVGRSGFADPNGGGE